MRDLTSATAATAILAAVKTAVGIMKGNAVSPNTLATVYHVYSFEIILK